MKRFIAIALLLAIVPTLAFARKKPKKPALPAIFEHARYVYVEAVDGDEFNPRLYPPDREAIADVMKAISHWKRYVLTYNREEADLVFVVRTGRLAGVKAGYSRGTIPDPQSRGTIPGPQSRGNPAQQGRGNDSAISVGAEAGPRDDLLEVCQIDPNGILSSPLWMRTQRDGLEAPDLPLLKELRKEVDSAYPLTQASKTKMP